MSAHRVFEYLTTKDRELFSTYGMPVLTSLEMREVMATSSMAEIGSALSKGLASADETIYFPASETMLNAEGLAATMALTRQKDQKSLYYVLYKPIVCPDNAIRVAAALVRDVGGTELEDQMVPIDQPPSAEICLQLVSRTYGKFRSTIPRDGREFSPSIPFEPYSLDANEQVDFLARQYRDLGYGKQRDPFKDQFEAFDKNRDYSSELIDAVESGIDVGDWLKGSLHKATESFADSSWLKKIPFASGLVKETLNIAADFAADAVGGFTSFYTDALAEEAIEIDPFLRWASNVPGADRLAYTILQAPNVADTTTGDLIGSIKVRLP